jgi:putative phosphonate metabolism protein
MNARYALYFAPAATSPLWRSGSTWLGRDACSGASLPQPGIPGITAERVRALTASPRRYGLHATLKPPFHLADGVRPEILIDAIGTLAGRLEPFTLPALSVAMLSDFIALRTHAEADALQTLADRCVAELDRFRRPAGTEELAKRRAHPLNSTQDALLQRYGYPYVMSEWRFHITLSEPVFGAERDLLLRGLADYFAVALSPPTRCDDVCLFVQQDAQADFVLHSRFTFGQR